MRSSKGRGALAVLALGLVGLLLAALGPPALGTPGAGAAAMADAAGGARALSATPAGEGQAAEARPAEAAAAGRGAAPAALAAQGGMRLEQIGHHALGGTGLNADVWLHKGIAYVGTWASGSDRQRGCPGTGVKIVDLSDPTQPQLLGSLAEHPGTSAEVMRVRSVSTPYFQGDLLAVGLQACVGTGERGVDLWDVTTPSAPQPLGFFATGPGSGGVHELDLVQRTDGRVLALLTVPFSESGNPQHLGDFRIVEVTNPRAPQELADWGAMRELGLSQDSGQGADANVYAHGAHASPDGMRAYVAYWDAGVVILDLTDPAAPRFLGRTSFPPSDQGNAHSTDLLNGGSVLVEADEVLDSEETALRIESPPEVAGMVAAGGGIPGPPWPDTRSVTAELVYLGRGCPSGDWTAQLGEQGGRVDSPDPYPSSPSGKIALLDRGTCPFQAKVERAKNEGAVGAIIVNSADAPLTPSSPQGQLGAYGIGRGAGDRLKAALAAGQPVTATLAADLHGYHDFGGLRFWDIADPARPRPLSTFRTARSNVDPARGPAEPGVYSAHNPVAQGNLLFVSWFSDGVRVLDVSNPGSPQELASWVPPAEAPADAVRNYLGEGAQVWGVAVDGDLVVASDINSGLWVLRLVH